MLLPLKMWMKNGWLILQNDIAKIGPFTLQSWKESTSSMVMIRLGTLVVCLTYYPMLFLSVSIVLLVTIIFLMPLIVMSFITRKKRGYHSIFHSSMKLQKEAYQTRL